MTWRSMATLAAIALLGTLLLWRSTDPIDNTPVQATTYRAGAESSPRSGHVLVAEGSAPRASSVVLREASAGQKTDLPTLMRAYAEAQGVRAFIDSAMRRPEQGGLTYAYAAFEVCFGDTYGTTGVPNRQLIKAPQAGEARAKLMARCDLSAAERRDLMTARMAMQADLLNADPFYAEVFRYLSDKAGAGAVDRLISNLLASQDIFAMYALLSLDPATLKASNGEGQYFGGQRFISESERRRLNDAYIYTSCSFGAPCGPESNAALRLCAERGWCDGGVQDALRYGYGLGEHDGEFRRLAESMTLAFRNRQHNAFVSADKPGG